MLISCSTGEGDKSIAAMLSKTWEARVFAPSSDTIFEDYELDDAGRITGLKLRLAQTREFQPKEPESSPSNPL